MEISELIWKLFLVLLPGVISTLVIRFATSNKSYPIFEFSIYAASLGIGNVILFEILISIWNVMIHWTHTGSCSLEWGLNLSIWKNLFNSSTEYNKLEFFWFYVLSLAFGLFWAFIMSKNIVVKILRKLKLTFRNGDEDVWTFFLNSPDTDWVLIRDHQRKLAYYGRVRNYSESYEKREILLEEVQVYTSEEWKEIYRMKAILLELTNFEYSLEIYNTPQDEQESTDY